jgi:hypothetical protein
MTETTNTTQTNKPQLGLPRDIAHKIFALLKPKSTPECVLLFIAHPWTEVRYKTGTLTDEERDFIIPQENVSFYKEEHTNLIKVVSICPEWGCRFSDTYIHAALLNGFRFHDQASRDDWKAGLDFELYRDAIHTIDTTSS